MHSIGTPTLWLLFTLLVAVAVSVDILKMRDRGDHHVGVREALWWVALWVGLAMLFNLGLWWHLREVLPTRQANEIALMFLTGYALEKALAVDNLFVFLLLFVQFAVPPERRQRVLVYGVIGAIVLRTLMIFLGAALVARFHWVLTGFGLLLVLSGLRMIWVADKTPSLERSWALRLLSRNLRLTPDYHGERFVVLIDGVRHYTPLFLVMAMIAMTDVIFAVDSIPAIFAITTDPFIVLTSNVLAVLGLRPMFFLLASMADRFHLLNYGLAFVLVFIGLRMLLADVIAIPVGVALAVIALAVGSAMLLSVLWPRKDSVPG